MSNHQEFPTMTPEARAAYEAAIDALITLLWLGKVNTVWIVSDRTNRRPWTHLYECSNWDLDTREWERTETPPEHAAFLATLGEGVQP
jgi:hypothetical protein